MYKPQHATATANDNAAKLALLTRQQINVLELSSQGLSARAVAAQLGLCEKTVKFHKTNLFKILGVRSTVNALITYQRITSNINHEILAPGEYATPAYSRIKQQLAEVKEKYASLLIYSNKQAQAFKELAMDQSALQRELDELKRAVSKEAPRLLVKPKPEDSALKELAGGHQGVGVK